MCIGCRSYTYDTHTHTIHIDTDTDTDPGDGAEVQAFHSLTILFSFAVADLVAAALMSPLHSSPLLYLASTLALLFVLLRSVAHRSPDHVPFPAFLSRFSLVSLSFLAEYDIHYDDDALRRTRDSNVPNVVLAASVWNLSLFASLLVARDPGCGW